MPEFEMISPGSAGPRYFTRQRRERRTAQERNYGGATLGFEAERRDTGCMTCGCLDRRHVEKPGRKEA